MLRWRRNFFGLGAAFPRFQLGQEKKGSWPLCILAGVVLFAFAAYAGPVLIPLLAAIVLYYLFAPLKRPPARNRIGALPVAIGAPLFLVAVRSTARPISPMEDAMVRSAGRRYSGDGRAT